MCPVQCAQCGPGSSEAAKDFTAHLTWIASGRAGVPLPGRTVLVLTAPGTETGNRGGWVPER